MTKSREERNKITKPPNMSSFNSSCFRRPATAENRHSPPQPPPPIPGKPNLATSLYHTDLGVFSLTWSRSFLGRSLHLHHYPVSGDYSASPLSLPTPSSSLSSSFHLHINPFFFWRKHGSKNLLAAAPSVQIFWDLSRARFGSGPEPESGYYIAVVVDGEMTLLVGDDAKRAYGRSKAQRPRRSRSGQNLVLRREHVIGQRVYTTRARFGGKDREISVNCGASDEARLSFSVDGKRVLQVKRLKWKFRGNERIEVDGTAVQVSWDVYNWLFDDATDSHAVFMFSFENAVDVDDGEESEYSGHSAAAQQQLSSSCSFGMNGVELRKMRRSFLRSSGRSSSSSSISSASSACSSSVMEWASTEESDRLSGPTGFSLLVYAWKK